MRASRGMGDISPSKIPGKPKKITRKDNPNEVDVYKEGGKVNLPSRQQSSKVNAAGNYTKPTLRKKLFNQVKASATQGTGAGQWSARKAQLLAKKYKASGGGYK